MAFDWISLENTNSKPTCASGRRNHNFSARQILGHSGRGTTVRRRNGDTKALDAIQRLLVSILVVASCAAVLTVDARPRPGSFGSLAVAAG
jgi:hypothetical protein